MTRLAALAFAILAGMTATLAAAAPHEPLSSRDAGLYREIFALQEKGAWAEADARIAKLSDDVLTGHVLFQRYMHPTKYRAAYPELKKWMAYYADHPEAPRIYQLALARRPKGDRGPVRPTPRQWRTGDEERIHPDLEADYARTSRPRLNQIEGRVRHLCRKEQAATALKEIDRHLAAKTITVRQYDRMRSWIAASYFYQGYLDAAERIATSAAARNGDSAVLAYWIAGLVAFREGDVGQSHDHFARMAAVTHQDDALRAGAGFWAARTALAGGKPAAVAPHLEIAAAYPFTFYGQLALAQLGREADFDWTEPALTEEGFAKLAEGRPAAKRAAALVQAGRRADAELELRWLNGAIPKELDLELMALATALRLPAAQLEIALAGDGPHLNAGLYPIPDYEPRGGFKADRAVLYAVMRQESKFKLEAVSRAGARGLMQIMPRTASAVARDQSLRLRNGRDRLFDPGLNLDIGQKYVNELIDRHTDRDLFRMAIAYNGGPGNLRRWDRKVGVDDPLLFIESIPNPESRDYVEKVLTNVWIYRARLGQPAPTRDKVAAGELPLYEALDQLGGAAMSDPQGTE